MAWYSTVTSLFTGSSKAVDAVSNIANGAVSGIDALFFTEEEKAEFSKETMKVWLEVQKVTAGESSIKSITRRLLACAFIAVYLIHLLGASIAYQFSKEYSTHLFNTAKSMNVIVMTIVIFYFGYYAVSNVMKAKKG